MSHTSDICTLVWPRTREADGSIAPMVAPWIWIVGWNPRGLSVVVAGFIECVGVTAALAQLEAIKGRLASEPTPPGLPPYVSLLLLGYVRSSSAPPHDAVGGSSGSPPTASPAAMPDPRADKDVRLMRLRSNMWLELLEGPMLGDVWCCGYRVQPCQLHVIRCDPTKRFSVKPMALTPCGLYGASGTRMLMAGVEPICVPGVPSNMEGVLIPPVLVKESAPQFPVAAERSPTDVQANSVVYTPHHHRSSIANEPSVGTYSDAGSREGSDLNPQSFPNSAVLEDLWSSGRRRQHSAPQQDLEHMSQCFQGFSVDSDAPAPPPRAGVPPSLDYTTTVDRTEMNTMLLMCQTGWNVERVLRGMPPRPNTFQAGRADPRTGSLVASIVTAFIHILLAFLRVVTPLKRFSWFMELVDQRVREVINVLALLSGRTTSCGLHPVLPHRICSDRRRQTLCLWNYVFRLLADVVVGVLLTTLLISRGPGIYAEAQYVSRYFLYGMQMGYMEWFEGWPAGLKMNEDLNKAMCFFAKTVLHSWDAIMRGHFWPLLSHAELEPDAGKEYFWLVPSYDVLVYLSFLGASCACALVADITGLVTLHLRCLYHAASLPYRFTKALLGSLWQQFMGKKYNPLRKRVDGYDFSVDQMLMATFLFTITTFLFPTVAVYYFYYAIIRTTVWGVQGILIALAHLILYTPIFPVVYWLCGSSRDYGGVALSEPIITMVGKTQQTFGPSHDGSEVMSTSVEVCVEPLALPISAVLAEYGVVISVLAKPFVPSRVLSLIVRGMMGRPASPYEVLMPHLLEDCISPPCTLCNPHKKKWQDDAGGSSSFPKS